jgi:hypothetical protein
VNDILLRVSAHIARRRVEIRSFASQIPPAPISTILVFRRPSTRPASQEARILMNLPPQQRASRAPVTSCREKRVLLEQLGHGPQSRSAVTERSSDELECNQCLDFSFLHLKYLHLRANRIVIRLAKLAFLPVDRGDVNDASPPARHHAFNHLVRVSPAIIET